jgi:hypothetical protein
MAIATPYGKFCLKLGSGTHNFTSDTVKVMLVTASYTPNIDTDEFASTPATNETTGTSYSTGGATLTSPTWTYDSANNWAQLSADSVTWSAASFTCRYAVIYKSTGTMSTSPLIGYIDFGTNKSPSTEDFILNFTSGVLRVKVA